MNYALTVSILCNSESAAQLIVESLFPEMQQRMLKSKIQLFSEDSYVYLSIEARDISTLRAVTNSYIRWIETAVNVQKLV